MSRRASLVLTAITIMATFGCLDSLAASRADKTLFLSYMESRVATFSSNDQRGLESQTEALPTDPGVTLDEARVFLGRASTPPSGWARGSVKQIEGSPKDVLNGWCSKHSGVLVASAVMSERTSAPVLFCVLDGKRIFELANECGFQPLSAKRWLAMPSRFPQFEKAKVISEAYAVSEGGGVIGYIASGGDFKKILDRSRINDVGLDDEDIKWFHLEAQHYSRNPSQIGENCALFVVWHPFLSLRRLCFSTTGMILEIENPQVPGKWLSTDRPVAKQKV